ncbi:MAG: hypothetical protein LUD39_05780 [Opitutae bacterium]|nr:hypothetical protein [Opitutae bacterium]
MQRRRHADAGGRSMGGGERVTEEPVRARSVSPLRIGIIGAIFLLCALFLIAGLAKRQIFESDDYLGKHDKQSLRIVMLPAPRGEICDRNGNPVVANRARYSVVVDLSDKFLLDEIDARYIENVKEAREIFQDPNSARIDRNVLLNNARIDVLRKYLNLVNAAIGRESDIDPKTVLRHFSQKRTLDFPLVENLTERERARFVEKFGADAPIRLYVDSVRFYPYGKLAAHVLGWLKNTDDIETPEEFRGLGIARYRGKTGATGVEMQFDEALRGVPGYRLWRVLPNGYLAEKIKEVRPTQGTRIYVSIDIELQQALEAAMQKVGRPGAAIALDVNTGEILALASAFAYDPNEFSVVVRSAYQEELAAQDANILVNRAVQGRYPPGSTFKIITAIAAMRSGKILPDQQFDCGSYLRVDNRNWPEHDGVAFGLSDVARMLRTSGNVYCYNAALELGWEPISQEAKRFGLDQKLPVELPEATGLYLVVPSPRYKRSTGAGGWVAGDTLNMAIGQGFLQTSPLHIACMTASLARNETRTKPSILFDPERQNTRVNHGGEPIGLTARARAKILQGMRESVEVGTGRYAKVEGLEIAGKTGTAQWQNRGKRSNLAWFTGFAPIDKPQVAVTVVFEADYEDRMAGGATAGPVAKEIFKKWRALYFKP